MAFTREQLEAQAKAIRTAIRNGAQIVRHGDKTVQYRSLREMQAALDDILNDLAALDGTKRSRFHYSKTTKGLA